ncbi:MAG: amino acid ABC transporter substrate-binding protein [Quinella sp. 1Q7]|nr:amino acid ABC transporter substrate-binding protein [Quinella sp. 1Q7]
MLKKFLLLMLMLMFATGCGTKTEKFVIGVDDEFPPMCFHDEQGELVGFDVDLARETARRMGVEFEFRPIDWNNKREELTAGNIDMIWNGLDITDERKEYMLFSKPYMNDRQILLVHAGNPQVIHAAGDLAGKVVGTQAGSSSETYINDIPRFKDSFAAFKTYRNFKDAFADLERGDVDALICNEITARYEMTRNRGKMELIEATIGPICEVGIAFRKDNTALRDRVQKAFDSMVADGTAKKISEQWFQADLIKRKR